MGQSDTIVYSPFIIHRTVRHAEPVNDHYGNATGHCGDPSVCSVYQALSPPLEGSGKEARLGAADSTMVRHHFIAWCSITAYTTVSPFPPQPFYSNSKTVVDLDKLLISEPDGMFH